MRKDRKFNIGIVGWGSISPLGISHQEVWSRYQSGESTISPKELVGREELVASLDESQGEFVEEIRRSKETYANLDRVTLFAIGAARLAVTHAGWTRVVGPSLGVSIGSSRGATETFEKLHRRFLHHPDGKTSVLTSPTTTLGNIASWAAQEVLASAIALSHSMTCTSALHAVANGVAWLRAGMCERFLVGGVEAPLTPFTIAQMKALRIYSRGKNTSFPCRPLDADEHRSNTLVLGEGAAVFAIERVDNTQPLTRGLIEGIGIASECIDNATAVTADGAVFESAMRQALQDAAIDTVDLILVHAPGTQLGDAAEYEAIKRVFGESIPLLSNKHIVGHTFGASAALHIEYALLILEKQSYRELPYKAYGKHPVHSKPIERIMINAAGFGGNATSLIVSKTTLPMYTP